MASNQSSNKWRGRLCTAGVVVALALGTGFPNVAHATGQLQPDSDSSNSVTPVSTRVEVRLDHAVTLPHAIQVAQRYGSGVISFRFENEGVVGEYATGSGQTASEFLAEFQSRFGTEPEIVAIAASPLSPAARKIGQSKVVTGMPTLVAPPVELRRDLRGPGAERATQQSAAATGDWRPDQAEIYLTNQGNRANIQQSYYWVAPSQPSQVPSGFGIELEVNLYNSELTGTRPNCYLGGSTGTGSNGYPGFKTKFWASHSSWNWAVYRPDFAGANLSALGAYADYNDLSDECSRNSMAIGLRYPRNIAYVNGGYAITAIIDAPRGTMASSKIGGLVQSVSDQWCRNNPGYSLTDCMGVTTGSWSLNVPRSRTTLDPGRGWIAPDKCWTSFEKGTIAPVLIQGCAQEF